MRWNDVRIVSWNILHGGGSRVDDILATVEAYSPDIVCLQEFRHGKGGAKIEAGLGELGLDCVCAPPTDSARENSVLLASCFEFTSDTFPDGARKPARCIAADFAPSGDDLKLIAAHFPQKRAQLPYFEALLDLPGSWIKGNSLVIGDINCGIPFEDSETRSFYATHLFQEMLRRGWVDAWRARNPQAREFTWISNGKQNGYRYDHALATESLNDRISSIAYDHEVREDGRSDHSLIVVDID